MQSGAARGSECSSCFSWKNKHMRFKGGCDTVVLGSYTHEWRAVAGERGEGKFCWLLDFESHKTYSILSTFRFRWRQLSWKRWIHPLYFIALLVDLYFNKSSVFQQRGVIRYNNSTDRITVSFLKEKQKCKYSSWVFSLDFACKLENVTKISGGLAPYFPTEERNNGGRFWNV